MPDLPLPSTVTFLDDEPRRTAAVFYVPSEKASKQFLLGGFKQSGVTKPLELPPIASAKDLDEYRNAKIEYLSPILSQLRGLLSPEEEEDRIEEKVVFWTSDVLIECALIAGERYKNKMPYGRVSPDSAGGLRIEWINEKTGVAFIVSAETSKACIYHEQGGKGAIDPASPALLAKWLQIIN